MSMKILSQDLFFPNTLGTPSVANFRVFKEMISCHSVRTHHSLNHTPSRDYVLCESLAEDSLQ